MISETKLDESLPINQFLIRCFVNPIRFYGTCHSGGILLYKRRIKEKICPLGNSNIKIRKQI